MAQPQGTSRATADANTLSMLTVQQTLERMSMSDEIKDFIMDRRDAWVNFGKMNSHIYRAMLMKRMRENQLSAESQLMVFFFFSVIKNQSRVIKAMDAMNSDDKGKRWFPEVRNFINVHVTQYVSDVARSKKFPAVNIPSCNPGFDLLAYCLMTHPNDRSLVDFFNRPTSVQLSLDQYTQELARQGYQYYWDVIINGSRNPDSKGPTSEIEPPKYREDYYLTSAADNYKLIGVHMREIAPLDVNIGYTLQEIYNYMKSIDLRGEYNVTVARLEGELARMLPAI